MLLGVEATHMRCLVSDLGPFGMFIDLNTTADIHVMDLVVLAGLIRVCRT